MFDFSEWLYIYQPGGRYFEPPHSFYGPVEYELLSRRHQRLQPIFNGIVYHPSFENLLD